MKTQLILKLITCCILVLGVGTNSLLAANDKDKKDKKYLKMDVLEYMTNSSCKYVGMVTVEVEYKLKHFSSETGVLIMESSNDGVNFIPVKSKEVEEGKGSTYMTFDVGGCALSFRASMQ